MRLLLVFAALSICGCSSGQADERRHKLDRLHQDPRCNEAVSTDMREPHVRSVGSDGVVNTERVAKNIAHTYLKVVYPEDRHLRPMRVTLSNGVWTVNGTLPKGLVGGVAGITICQSNGRVLEIAHGK